MSTRIENLDTGRYAYAIRAPWREGHLSLDAVRRAEEALCKQPVRLWPWEVEPYRLWSLLDMKRLLGATFVNAVRSVDLAKLDLVMANDEPAARARLAAMLMELLKEAQEIPLRTPPLFMIERLAKQVEGGLPTDYIPKSVDDVLVAITAELGQFLFFVVTPERRQLYESPDNWYGREALERYPTSTGDVRGACQCLALGQWTASVFHAMRILEHGLRAMALEVQIPAEPATATWGTILDQIEQRIPDHVRTTAPKGPQRDAYLRHLSAAASQFRYFKDAWRNHVSHAHSQYDEQEARWVLDGVKRFMEQLATRRTPS